MPTAPEGFKVTKFADGFDNCRWLYVTSNGDVLVAESNSNHPLIEKIGGTIIGASKSNNLSKSADRITLLRDHDKDGLPEVHDIFLEKLAQPFSMAVIDDWFYVANTDAIWRFPYQPEANKNYRRRTKDRRPSSRQAQSSLDAEYYSR